MRTGLHPVRHPRLTIGVVVLLSLTSLPGLLRLQMRTDGQSLLPEDVPEIAVDCEIRARFGFWDQVTVVIESPARRPGALAASRDPGDGPLVLARLSQPHGRAPSPGRSRRRPRCHLRVDGLRLSSRLSDSGRLARHPDRSRRCPRASHLHLLSKARTPKADR